MALLAQAFKDERFNIPEAVLQNAPEAMQKILDDPKSTQREKISAAKVIVAMVNSNRSSGVKEVRVTHDLSPEAREALEQRRAEVARTIALIGQNG